MPKVACPVCGGPIEVMEDSLSGELFEHNECGAQVELVIDEKGVMSFKLAEEVAEDWGE